MVTQFGYVSLWSICWPLACRESSVSAFSLSKLIPLNSSSSLFTDAPSFSSNLRPSVPVSINNYFELRSDALKVCLNVRRPIPSRFVSLFALSFVSSRRSFLLRSNRFLTHSPFTFFFFLLLQSLNHRSLALRYGSFLSSLLPPLIPFSSLVASILAPKLTPPSLPFLPPSSTDLPFLALSPNKLNSLHPLPPNSTHPSPTRSLLPLHLPTSCPRPPLDSLLVRNVLPPPARRAGSKSRFLCCESGDPVCFEKGFVGGESGGGGGEEEGEGGEGRVFGEA